MAVTAERPLRADAARNRERLIAAARAALAERGVDASMEEVARAAELGVGTLYRHFPRRIDLVEAVYRADVDVLVALGAEVAEQLPPWEALTAFLQGFVRYAASKRTFLSELHEAFEKDPRLAPASRERIGAAITAVLSRAQADGAARGDVDAADVQQLIGGMCMSPTATLEQNERLLGLVLDGLRVG